MTLKPKPEFDYKPAFKLALLSNAIVLSVGALLLSKSRVDSVPTFRQQESSDRQAKRELHMKSEESVAVSCPLRDSYSYPRRPTIYIVKELETAKLYKATLWCTYVYNGKNL